MTASGRVPAPPTRLRSPPPPPAGHSSPPTLPATIWASSTRSSRPRSRKRREGADLSDFVWYHAFELPDGRVLPGAWDLRGHESAYLGGVDVAGKRVLELGPATGYLTFYMERMGAEVVAFEAGFDVSIDVMPVQGREDPEERRQVMQDTIDRNHDAWWYLHRTIGSSAKFVQGNIYDMPADLGHLRHHPGRGHPACTCASPGAPSRRRRGGRRETMIVTEPLQDDWQPPESNIMRFSPSAEHHLTNWWSIYPGAVVSMLSRLGFGRTETTMHTPAPPPGPRHGERRRRPADVHRRRPARRLSRTGRRSEQARRAPPPLHDRGEEAVVARDEDRPLGSAGRRSPGRAPRARPAARRRRRAGRAPPRTRG